MRALKRLTLPIVAVAWMILFYGSLVPAFLWFVLAWVFTGKSQADGITKYLTVLYHDYWFNYMEWARA